MSHPAEKGTSSDASPPTDLPPVEPPTAGFILQLFVLPAVVVVVVIAVWLLFGKLAGGERDPIDYVRAIQSSNANQRYRAAFELASLIHNDRRLAEDRLLLGELTVVLGRELDRAEAAADRLRSPDVQSDQADHEDPLPQYLALALGAFRTLEAKTEAGRPADPIATLARALGPRQPPPVRLAAAESLARQAARLEDGLKAPEAVRALAAAADGDAPSALRERAVYALGFFGGEEAATALRLNLGPDQEDRSVRYNAAAALARRGDPAALAVVREMLTTRDLEEVASPAVAREAPNRIEVIELEALRALQHAARAGHPDLARQLLPEATALTRSGLVSVRTEAAALVQLLQAAP